MKIPKRRKLNIIWLVFLGIIFAVGLIRLLSGEDNWICQNGQWVEHGHPSITKPTGTCGNITPSPEEKLYKVIRVTDGDTIEIEGGQKVRYIGINTPELANQGKPTQCFAMQAALANKNLVEGKKVKLVKDVSETDKYGRLLRYVYVGDIFVNDYLVRQGFAQVMTYPPDVRLKDQFLAAQQEAKNNNRGLWNPKICPK